MAFAKICGLSTPETVAAALAGKAAYVGFMFFEKSPRYVTPDVAARLAAAVRGIPPELERYKSLRPFRAALLDYLDRQSGAGSNA